ncbi:MAG TPA: MOSC N-terminal beta barrel domain-containing protein, partial [Stellaceae bacterium]|nr:MOSC N-terminal beta barrel domain-containing protein [Stellaceae bacterium]
MTATIAALYRYPVKGLSPEPLQRVALTPGRCLPQDRRFAIALPTTEFDAARPQWLSKTHFIMLMRDEKLAALRTRFDAETGRFSVEEGGEALLEARLTEREGQRAVGEFFTRFLEGLVAGPLRVVEAPGHAFADARPKPNASTDQYVSLINRASIAALEQAVGAPVDPVRFRANVYFDGPPAWAELDWLGQEIGLGQARLRVIAAITRCAATEVNPATAVRDLDVVGA